VGATGRPTGWQRVRGKRDTKNVSHDAIAAADGTYPLDVSGVLHVASGEQERR